MHRGDHDLEMMGNRLLGVSLTMAGRFDETRPHHARATELYDATRHRPLAASVGLDPIVLINCYRALAELALGHPDQASSLIGSALENNRLTKSINAEGYMLFHSGTVAAAARQAEQTLALGTQMAELSAKHGLSFYEGLAPGIIGMGLLERGDVEGALRLLSRWLALAEAGSTRLLGAFFRAALAQAMAADRDEGAFAMAKAAEKHATGTGALFALAASIPWKSSS